MPNPGEATKGAIGFLSRANMGLKCLVGFPCAGPTAGPSGGRVYRALSTGSAIAGTIMNVLMNIGGVKADIDHYLGDSTSDEKPRDPDRKVIMAWPFPGFTFQPVPELPDVM